MSAKSFQRLEQEIAIEYVAKGYPVDEALAIGRKTAGEIAERKHRAAVRDASRDAKRATTRRTAGRKPRARRSRKTMTSGHYGKG